MVNSIYNEVNEKSLIKQGDIFLNLPFVLIKDSKISTFENDPSKGVDKDLGEHTYKDDIDTTILVNMKVLPGIIISQNCDILRNKCLSFCAIRLLEEVDGTYKHDYSQKSDMNIKKIDYFTKKYKFQEKYFYLPSDDSVLPKKMAVDFSTIFQIKTEVVKQLIKGRKLTLNNIALLHFRQKISNYFMRFVYDPWYPLNKDEFEAYFNNIKDDSEKDIIEPYDWQK